LSLLFHHEADKIVDDNSPEFLNFNSTSQPETAAKPAITFQGNSYDLAAVVGVTIGGITLLSCATCNLGVYLLPFLPLILGLIGLITAKDSVNPERTRLLSWISIGSGAVILLLILVVIILYIGFFVFAIANESSGGF
jgi:hypothetical protein